MIMSTELNKLSQEIASNPAKAKEVVEVVEVAVEATKSAWKVGTKLGEEISDFIDTLFD